MAKSALITVYGGQFGSEGKGQVVAHLYHTRGVDVGVRVGGPNAGHTFFHKNGRKQVVQTLPIPAALGAHGVIGAAGMVLLDVLDKELQETHEFTGKVARLSVDRNAVVITAEHMSREAALKGRIGSTGEGVGAATADKVMRTPGIVAGHEEMVKYVTDEYLGRPWWAGVTWGVEHTPSMLNSDLQYRKRTVLLEGTQGYGLSLHTGGYYPFCTSRECTPQGIQAQAGVAESRADEVERIMVLRTYPIRVGGNSGPLPGEVSWEELSERTGGYVKPEITTVTKKVRRIAAFDWELVNRAVLQTNPTGVALMFLDYVHPEIAGVVDPTGLGAEHWRTIQRFEERLGVPIKYVGTGPGTTVSLRVNK